MKKLMSKFHFRSIYKTIVLTLILCFLYNIAYLFMSASDMNVYVRQSLEVGLSLLSSLGCYFICTKIWKKKNFSFQAIFKVLLLQAIYILIVSGILTNLVNICTKNMGLMLVLQLMSAFCLVVMVPFQLIFYYGLIHDKNLKEFIPMAIKKHQKSMLNWYCTLLICIIVFDTMTGGLFSAAQGFNAQSILVGSMYMGNPMMSWMMYLFLGVSFSSTLASMFTYLFMNFLMGFFYCILELNYVSYVGSLLDAD
ncbi:hypothetical protein KSW27_01580 [Holdemanella biformis]|uniref:hypothetical protein n=1 Tax=Holdemanella biformis TaxID=1735 RepID=UPI001C2783FF|nr:hypothetical protein [Holdemanella biformis]MBU9895826.1 hypothetical protein [Holdemanella biformis]MBV3415985.1 hypothetical protein [Holdemanella biformis]